MILRRIIVALLTIALFLAAAVLVVSRALAQDTVYTICNIDAPDREWRHCISMQAASAQEFRATAKEIFEELRDMDREIARLRDENATLRSQLLTSDQAGHIAWGKIRDYLSLAQQYRDEPVSGRPGRPPRRVLDVVWDHGIQQLCYYGVETDRPLVCPP